ncbi:AfsR/SARP family transcriptional regulator [Paractinoplanes durhamensis]|uniref:AfsR/SARP family transcriptional regulator n=1 Tax=Paractinoplanes durhamensis TaxID=113563 RepID=UPI001945300C|nr:tetratricopeptide repeat protein [Actinoplanes durhamensis]
MEFGILGTTELIHDGRVIPLGPAKQRGMIAVLLYHAGEPVRVSTMIELLWGRPGNVDHRPTLYSLASRLRAALAQAGLDKALVRVSGIGAYRLDVDPGTIDLHRFRRQLTEAREATAQGRPESSAEILLRALPLWRGDPLPELGGARADQLRRSLGDVLLDAHKLLAESQLACGRPHAVLDQLDRLIQIYDLDEGLARCWIRALSTVGRHDEAKRFVIAFRRRFRKEMRTEPDVDIVPTRSASWSTADRIPRHMRPDIADFTGRQALLDELGEMRGNVVVITGMPGVGKTTLATHWAHRRRQMFPDGQLYLDAGAYGLASPVDPQDALERFLRILGVPPDQIPVSLEQRRDRFEDLIGDRRIFLLIDNVLDSAQVRPLIPRSMNCLTVITSRTRLSGLTIRDGVRTVTVAPLSEDESTSLLARIVGSKDASDLDGLTALAELSGGLPLALRIIGERVAERPRSGIAELAGELRHRLLETAGEDDQAAALTTVFDWSYRALGADAARLFRQISHHPGTNFGPDAAAAIAGLPVAHAEALLNVLAKAHMINHDSTRRYRFHGLLHQYAVERSAGDDPAVVRQEQRRMLDWYLLSAAGAVAVTAPEWPPMTDLPSAPDVQPMSFGTDTEAMNWCAAEQDNLCAVSRWAQNHGFDRHGWQIPGVVHEILERYGCRGDILELNRQALVAARRDEHEVGQIGILNNLGATYFAVHDYDRAVAAFIEARHLAAATGNFEAETLCSHNLASTYVSLGEVPRAIEIYERALQACRKMGLSVGESAVLNWLGAANLQLGQYQRAAENYHQALAIRERIGAKRGTGQSHSGLGALYLASGQLRLALWHCETARVIHAHAHDQEAECDTLITLADVQRNLEMHAEAVHSGQRAILLGELVSDSFRQVAALTAMGDALAAAGDPKAAMDQARMARRILDDLSGAHVPPLHKRLLVLERTVQIASPESRAG